MGVQVETISPGDGEFNLLDYARRLSVHVV